MNNIVKVSSLCLASLAMVGCSTSVVIGAVTTSTSTSISQKHAKFKGGASYSINVKEGKSIKVEITTTSGMLDVTIESKDGVPYEGHISEDATFTVNVEAGRYDIKLYGHDHVGSYKFDWGN